MALRPNRTTTNTMNTRRPQIRTSTTMSYTATVSSLMNKSTFTPIIFNSGFSSSSGGCIKSNSTITNSNDHPTFTRSMKTFQSTKEDHRFLKKKFIIPQGDDKTSQDATGSASTASSLILSSNATRTSSSNNSSSNIIDTERKPRRFTVRFSKEAIDTKTKKRKESLKENYSNDAADNNSSKENDCSNSKPRRIHKRTLSGTNEDQQECALWYTPREIDDMRTSMLVAVKRYDNKPSVFFHSERNDEMDDDDIQSLCTRYSLPNRKRRKIIRKQMYKTCIAVREFETATGTNQDEMLSQLLHLKSRPMVNEATNAGSRIAFDVADDVVSSSSSSRLQSLSVSSSPTTTNTTTSTETSSTDGLNTPTRFSGGASANDTIFSATRRAANAIVPKKKSCISDTNNESKSSFILSCKALAA